MCFQQPIFFLSSPFWQTKKQNPENHRYQKTRLCVAWDIHRSNWNVYIPYVNVNNMLLITGFSMHCSSYCSRFYQKKNKNPALVVCSQYNLHIIFIVTEIQFYNAFNWLMKKMAGITMAVAKTTHLHSMKQHHWWVAKSNWWYTPIVVKIHQNQLLLHQTIEQIEFNSIILIPTLLTELTHANYSWPHKGRRIWSQKILLYGRLWSCKVKISSIPITKLTLNQLML